MDCKLTFFSITPALYTLPAFVRKFTNNSCKNNHVFIHTEKTLNKINMKNLLIILFACFTCRNEFACFLSSCSKKW